MNKKVFINIRRNKTNKNKMKNLTVDQVKTELSKVNIYEAIDIASKRFVNACYDLGLSVEQSQRIMVSKQGLNVIVKEATKLI